MRRSSLVVLVVAACGLLAAPASAAFTTCADQQDELRDPARSRHSWGDLGFGAGYAYAEDNLCTLANEIVTVRAQRSRFFGPERGHGRVGQGLQPQPRLGLLLAADQRPRRGREAGRAAGTARAEAGRCESSCAASGGLQRLPALPRRRAGCPTRAAEGKAWVRPITARDLWRRYYQLGLIASGGQFVGDMVATQPPGASRGACRLGLARRRRALVARAARPADRLERRRRSAASRP